VDTNDASYTKAMTKFSKSKNAGELQYEIDKVRVRDVYDVIV
jgi:hypothetical protein